MKFFTRRSLVSLPAVFAYLWITVTLCCIFPNLPIDDAYIHLQFIKNWALGYGLCFNPGEFSLGCTSYLYVVIVGTGMGALGKILGTVRDPVTLIRAFGIVCGLGVLLMAWRWLDRRDVHPVCLVLGLLFLGIVRPFTSTAASGMETIFFSFVVLALLTLADDDRPSVQALAGVASGCLYLIRPDGLLAVICYLHGSRRISLEAAGIADSGSVLRAALLRSARGPPASHLRWVLYGEDGASTADAL